MMKGIIIIIIISPRAKGFSRTSLNPDATFPIISPKAKEMKMIISRLPTIVIRLPTS